MTSIVIKLFGLSSVALDEVIVGAFVILCLSIIAGIIIDGLSERSGFGPFGNTLVLMGTMLSGLVVYAQYVMPLRHAPVTSIIAVAIGSAVAGFLALSFVKSSALPMH